VSEITFERAVKCPECDGEVLLGKDDQIDGVLISCPECGVELEVVASFNPSDPNSIAHVRRVAIENVGEGDVPFNPDNLHTDRTPILIPAPRVEEDHGE